MLKENIAVTPAILKQDFIMSDDQFRREAFFMASMAAFNVMLAKRIITEDQHTQIEKVMADKYNPTLCVFPLTY